MHRLLLFSLTILTLNAQRTFQNTQFDISGDLPSEDPAVLAQAEGVPTHVNKNDLKPVKLQKPAELAVSTGNPQGPAAVQPLPLPTPAPIAAPLPPIPVTPSAPQVPTLPTLPPMPTLASFTFPTFTFPSHPTLAPFTFPSLPPQPSPASITFPTPAPQAGSAPVPQSSDYDEPIHLANKSPSLIQSSPPPPASTLPPPVPSLHPQSQVVQPVLQQPQNYYFTPEYIQWVALNYPDHYRQNFQYYQYYSQSRPVVQPQVQTQSYPALSQPIQLIPTQSVQAPPLQPQQPAVLSPTISIQPAVASGVSNVVPPAQGAAQIDVHPHVIKLEPQPQDQNVSPSRHSNWFREQTDTSACKQDLRKIAKLFKAKFPAYLQKGGKDAALADLVEKRLIECDEKGATGHWDKVDGLLTKIQLSKSEEAECRSGLIQERISCQNLLNFSCQFTNNTYQFKLVPARIVIQEARQAEGGAEKCRKVVRLVKKRLEG